jgi:hypothetical protein
MFSNITMASSTTSPIASTRASRVRMLIEKPSKAMTAKVPITEIGIAVIGMTTARQSRRKKKITAMTMAKAMKKVVKTSSTERWTNTELSYPTVTTIPSGSSASMVGMRFLTPSATSNRLDFDWRTTPRPTVGTPLKKVRVR